MQIRNQVVVGIASGQLATGEKLPTIRALAEQSSINMMTVSKAYQMLRAEGYIQTDRRSGATVCGGAPSHKLGEKELEQLRLLAAQARLAGLSREVFASLCEEAYGEVE